MAESVTRVVTGDVYSWMTPVEGVPGRWQHNSAMKGQEIEVSSAEAERGEGLGFLAEVGSGQAGPAPDGAVGDESPPRAANKAAWVDFAVTRGADRDEAEAMTKDELAAAYGA